MTVVIRFEAFPGEFPSKLSNCGQALAAHSRMRFVLLLILISVHGFASAAVNCQSNWPCLRIEHFSDLTFNPQIPDYFDRLLIAMRQDPNWKPELYGFSSQDIEVTASVRANHELMSGLDRVKADVAVGDPANAIEDLKTRYKQFTWSSGPLSRWTEKIESKWSIILRFNDAANCLEIPKLEVGPIRQQQNPWCAAMVGADILSQQTGVFASASSLMLQLNLRNYKPGVGILPEVGVDQPLFTASGAASIGQVLHVGVEDGFCREENFKSSIVDGQHSSFIIRNFMQQSSSGKVDTATLKQISDVFGGIEKNSAVLVAPYEPGLISKIADGSCRPYVSVTDAQIVDHVSLNLDLSNPQTLTLTNEIDNSLARQHIVGIGIISDSIGYNPSINQTNGHAVSIVGRRFNATSKKCEYLIRNSAGRLWGSDGYKFVPRTELLPSISEIVYMK